MHNGESNNITVMFCIFPCENICACSMLDPWLITNLLMRLILNTNHFGIKISKFNFINFLSTTNKIFWQLYIVFSIFRIKKPISCIQTVCKIDIAYPWKKKLKFFANINKRSMSLRTILRFYEKFNFYEIWNKYIENTFAFTYFFKHFQSILWFITSKIQHTCIYISYGPEHLWVCDLK